MMYADYKFYTEIYGGRSIAEGDFPRLAAKSSALIDHLTFGRAAEHSDDERLKMCCCELCESLALTDGNGGMVRQSESVGSWSYSLGGSENVSEGTLTRAACRAWFPAEWLYRGVYKE